jgi:nucleotide-binding universal stress UspA family protein
MIMYRHFLVPLDGSRLAEAVLPGTLELARRCEARLTLLHILEQAAPASIHGDRHLRDLPEAAAYLSEVAGRLEFPRERVTLEVHPNKESDIARSIFEHAGELGADLVVLSTHGRSGLREWISGGVAQHLLRRKAPPVFMLQPTPAGAAPAFNPRRMLVYLDGTKSGEAGLSAAEPLARACGMQIHLVMCIPTLSTLDSYHAAIGTMLPGTVNALLDLAEQGAADQLRAHVDRLQTGGVTTTVQIMRGDPLHQLVESARLLPADIICLTTQGESGLAALGTEAIAPKILTRFSGGLLLVHGAETSPG